MSTHSCPPTSPPLVTNERVVVIGDCHLAVGEPERTRLVLRFLDQLPSQGRRLIILGDLFDFWLGAKHLLLPDFQEVLDKLRQLTDQGIDIRLIPGNRDFLLDKHFTERTGIRLLGDFEMVYVETLRARLTHGDLLCTRDWRYHLWRRIVRNRLVRWVIGWMPLFLMRWLAVWMRDLSKGEVKRKAFPTMGFVESAVAGALEGDVDVLIVGHSHTPETRAMRVGGVEKKVYVLGDWQKVGIYLILGNGGISFHCFSEDEARPLEVPHRHKWE